MLLSKCEVCEFLVTEQEQERQRMVQLNTVGFVDGKTLCRDCRNTNVEIKVLLTETI
jgi:hypothetical protein